MLIPDDAGSSASPQSEIPEWPPPKHPTEVDHDSKEEGESSLLCCTALICKTELWIYYQCLSAFSTLH